MRAVNLLTICQAIGIDNFDKYEKILASRDEETAHKSHELDNLAKLTARLGTNADFKAMGGFYTGFVIDQIGKEFDLLKYDKERGVLNVELKSQNVGTERIKKQLRRNRYYLSAISKKVFLYTYVEDIDMLYRLNDSDELEEAGFEELGAINNSMNNYLESGIEEIFRPIDYLIAPLSTPDKFLFREYFLTQDQERTKTLMRQEIDAGVKSIGVTGATGTGKTLLIYDFARELADSFKVCLLHVGSICEGHRVISESVEKLDIIEMQELGTSDISGYDFLIVDEAQRISDDELDTIRTSQQNNDQVVIYAYDYGRIMSLSEVKRNIPARLKENIDFVEHSLSGKIRTNKSINLFIKSMFDLSSRPHTRVDYSNIDVLYIKDLVAKNTTISYYQKNLGYVYIDYLSESNYVNHKGEKYTQTNLCDVWGQEFERVIVCIDSNVFYDLEGKLKVESDIVFDYLPDKLLYQALSRCREKLCIIVNDNYPVFEQLINILDRM